MNTSLMNSSALLVEETTKTIADFLPAILGALFLLVVGGIIAKAARGLVIKLFESLNLSKAVKKTPIEHFLENAELGSKIEVIIGNVAYWLIMLVVVQSAVSVLGLHSLVQLLDRVLGYLPRILAAIFVLFFGVLLAGLVEALIKGALKTIDASSSRLFGKVASYLVVTISVMAAISELGIANEFILILFVGLVTAMSLGFGLALGLGGKDLIQKLLDKWYKNLQKQVTE